jgi:hypothetical protein
MYSMYSMYIHVRCSSSINATHGAHIHTCSSTACAHTARTHAPRDAHASAMMRRPPGGGGGGGGGWHAMRHGARHGRLSSVGWRAAAAAARGCYCCCYQTAAAGARPWAMASSSRGNDTCAISLRPGAGGRAPALVGGQLHARTHARTRRPHAGRQAGGQAGGRAAVRATGRVSMHAWRACVKRSAAAHTRRTESRAMYPRTQGSGKLARGDGGRAAHSETCEPAKRSMGTLTCDTSLRGEPGESCEAWSPARSSRYHA